MINPLIRVKVRKTGKIIEVYRHFNGGYVDYNDCKTIYQSNEIMLKFK